MDSIAERASTKARRGREEDKREVEFYVRPGLGPDIKFDFALVFFAPTTGLSRRTFSNAVHLTLLPAVGSCAGNRTASDLQPIQPRPDAVRRPVSHTRPASAPIISGGTIGHGRSPHSHRRQPCRSLTSQM